MRTLLFFLLAMNLYRCAPPADMGRAAFITLLGNDTLAVEQFSVQDQGLQVEVLVRTPETSYRTYEISWNGEEQMQTYRGVQYSANGQAVLFEEELRLEGDSLVFTRTTAGDTTLRRIAAQADALPFVDMLHWPFELAVRKMYRRQLDGLDLPMFTGRGFAKFEIRRTAPDSVSIRHPSRGVMYAVVGPQGELIGLDAGETTRKLTVSRVEEVDIAAMKQRFMAADAAGKGFGPLSGQVEESFAVRGANIGLSYGSPSRRGRELFGGIVPWNERWRTGANRATHFSTDKDLQMGDLLIPPGEYTLFTIPAPEGGALVINRQTGQNGQSYDEAQDHGRVPMTRTRQEESVEQFTIEVVETPEGGALHLIWGADRFEIPFVILGGAG